MYKESDHAGGGMSMLTRVAWMAVGFMILFVLIPALTISGPPQTAEPKKATYTQPLRCYGDTIVEGDANGPSRAVLICDPPVTGALPTSTPR